MFRFGDPGGYPYGTTANVLLWWTNESHFKTGGTSGPTVVTNGGWTGTTNCLRISVAGNVSGGNWAYIWKTLDNQATYGIAFRFKTDTLVATPIAIFQDSGTTQVDIRLASDGSLTVTRNGTSLGSAPAGTITLNTWIHIELKATINSTTGTIYLGINGTQVLNLTSQNTQATSNSYANNIYIGPSAPPNSTTMACDYQDVIIYDGQTTDANGNTAITGPIGDCSLLALFPNGAGTTTNFIPDSGSNYARVNETTPDGDTSYVADGNVGDIDTYTLADLPGTVSTVKSMATFAYARKDNSGSRSIAHELRSGGTNYSHATTLVLSTSYTYSFNNWGQNPNGPTNWTPTSINALEIGQKVSA